ncbi:hypothetical protein PT974_09639 [Cladobotryum mycophilum]|uniref:Uncharacterized protein n=1 Tax=Cladobotryum mycophilum TaxID=491253 RepID=A0ABR0SGS9_9HYPO
MEAVAISEEDSRAPEIGSGTQRDPLITWLITPPQDHSRRRANEMIARELGFLGYVHVWIRHCDHCTTRIRDDYGDPRIISCDRHVTVYAGYQPGLATKQGHIYCHVSKQGIGRIMKETERTDSGKSVELHPFPGYRQRNIRWPVIKVPGSSPRPIPKPSPIHITRRRDTRRGSMCGSPLRFSESSSSFMASR